MRDTHTLEQLEGVVRVPVECGEAWFLGFEDSRLLPEGAFTLSAE